MAASVESKVGQNAPEIDGGELRKDARKSALEELKSKLDQSQMLFVGAEGNAGALADDAVLKKFFSRPDDGIYSVPPTRLRLRSQRELRRSRRRGRNRTCHE